MNDEYYILILFMILIPAFIMIIQLRNFNKETTEQEKEEFRLKYKYKEDLKAIKEKYRTKNKISHEQADLILKIVKEYLEENNMK